MRIIRRSPPNRIGVVTISRSIVSNSTSLFVGIAIVIVLIVMLARIIMVQMGAMFL